MMAKLEKVDFNPFGSASSADEDPVNSGALTPVEGNPFKSELGQPQSVLGGQFGIGGQPIQSDQSEPVKELIRQSTGVDKSKGVDDLYFRAAWSRTDTDAERSAFLNSTVGSGLWRIDDSGEYLIKPEGLQKLGITSEFDRPIDEAGFSTGDLADFAGDAPAILGGVGGSVAATGLGLPAGLLVAGAGAAIGKGLDEAVEFFQGKNLQSAGDVGIDIAKAGLEGAVGEGLFRTGAAIGRTALAPFSKSSTPERLALAKQASDIGVEVTPSQINNNALVSRFRGLLDAVLGSDLVTANAKALDKEVIRLGAIGADRSETGKAFANNVLSARQGLRNWAKSAYEAIDDATGGQPFIPTRKYKEAIKNQMETLLDSDGNVIIKFKSEFDGLAKSLAVPDLMTTRQLQKLSDGIDIASNPLTRTLDDHTASVLKKSINESYDDTVNIPGNELAARLLKETRSEYAKRRDVFNDAVLKRIVKDPRAALTTDPEKVIDSIFKPRQSGTVRRVMAFADDSTKLKLQGIAMDKIMGTFKKSGNDPTEIIFNGNALNDTLNKFGNETLNAMFGKRHVSDLHRLADVTRLVGGSGKTSGLVAANIALHPLANIGVIVKLRVLNNLMRKPSWIRWMTIGIKSPRTRAGGVALSRATDFTSAIVESERANQRVIDEANMRGYEQKPTSIQNQ